MFTLKKKLYPALLCAMLSWASLAQEVPANYNFETFKDEEPVGLTNEPVGWIIEGNSLFIPTQDYEIFKEGKSSFALAMHETDEVNPMFSVSKILPNYSGKKLVFSGYIRTVGDETFQVTPVIRIDPMLDFVKLSELITGTNEWQKFEIAVNLRPEQAQQMVIAIQTAGYGVMWLDDFKVTIDGQDVSNAKVAEINFPAKQDKAFDQGSSVVFPALQTDHITNLALLGRVWGFLKYHHPAIAVGKYNWDYELFRFLPEYLAVTSKKERDALLLKWIDQLGMVKLCETCEDTDSDAILKPNLDWMTTYALSDELQQKIKYIYKNRNQDRHYYVSEAPGIGNAVFTNEEAYENREVPDAGFRLVGLYRFWNVMQYYMPNRHLTDTDWEDVLALHIRPFLEASDRLAYETAVLQLIAEVNDSHTDLWQGSKALNQMRGNRYAPFRVEFILNQLVVTDIYNPELIADIKLEKGDIITHINQERIEQILDRISPYHPGSNRSAQLRDISLFNILRTNEEEIEITYVDRNYKEQHATIKMYPKSELKSYGWFKPLKGEPSYRFLEDNIGYVTLGNIQDGDVQKIKDTFRNTEGIIIDIRNYPSAFVPFTLGSFFVSETKAFARFSKPNYKNPGEIVFDRVFQVIEPDGEPYQGQVVVLVDERTQSSAEYTAMAFKVGDRVTLVGSQTAGADGNVSSISFPGGLGTYISGLGVYYPDGKETQRIGIVPNLDILKTIHDVRNNVDTFLETGVKVIKGTL